LLRIDPGAARQLGGSPFLGRFAPGVSRDAGLAAVANDIKSLPNPYVTAAERPASVVSLVSIAGLPAALSGLLALIAVGTLAHTLASSTRRRLRDLAVLKTLGFIRRQVRQAVAVAGHHDRGDRAAHRAARRRRRRRGTISPLSAACCPRAAVPLAAIFIAMPGALAEANLIAAAPGQAAAHTARHRAQGRVRKGEPRHGVDVHRARTLAV
jgi:hypothetical protein